MDNDMIVQYINGVQPDFSYGTSDGMSRAMVESVENMAMINDYITESTYEVITEAKEDKPGFWGKLGNKISYYFALFMRLVNKFITKIKGFFMTVKRKLTMAFAKAIKAVASFLRNRINNNKKKFDTVNEDDEIEKYSWNNDAESTITTICNGVTILNTIAPKITKLAPDEKISYKRDVTSAKDDAKQAFSNRNETGSAYNDIVEIFNNVKEELNEVISSESDNTNNSTKVLLKKETVTFETNATASWLKDEFSKNVSSKVDKVYNATMKGCTQEIKILKELEKLAKKNFKKSLNKNNETFSNAKDYYKAINYTINQMHLLKYRAAGKMASACFKYYKKLFSAVRKVFGGFNIFGKSGDAEDKEDDKKQQTKAEHNSVDLLIALQ